MRFLAVLELYKQGMVDILQFTNFGELLVRRLQDGESALDVASLADWDDDAGDDAGDEPATTKPPRATRSSWPRSMGVSEGPAPAQPEHERLARRAIEAVVLASSEPVEVRLLAQLVELPVTRVEELCRELAAEYEESGRGFVLAQVAGGYRFQTHPDLSAYVERFVLEGRHARLSGPSLETLAIVAYKQPISRGQMSAIRGVNVEATAHHAAPTGLRAGGRARRRAPARPCSTARRTSSWSGSASRRSTTSRRWATSCPMRRWSRRSSGACASTTTRPPPRPNPPTDPRWRARGGVRGRPVAGR